MDSDNVTITFTKDEALVLFDLLWGVTNEPFLTIRDSADRTALWALVCLLERELVEPLREDFPELVAAARARMASS